MTNIGQEARAIFESTERIGRGSIDAYRDAMALVGRESDGAAIAGLDENLRDLQDPRIDLAVVGEMNAGKSTLLNALLGIKSLPMSPTACTAKLTFVEYGETRSAHVAFLTRDDFAALEHASNHGDDGASTIVSAARKELANSVHGLLGTDRDVAISELDDYVAVGGKYTPIVSQLTMRLPHPFGPNVRIVDTPGLRDPVASRSRVTREYIGRASAVVVTLYAGQPMNAEDYRLLREELVDAALDRIVVVLNKIDAVSSSNQARVVAYVNEKLGTIRAEARSSDGSTSLLDALGSAKAVPTSSLLALIARFRADVPDGDYHEPRFARRFGFRTYEEAWKMSGFPELESTVADVVRARDVHPRVRRSLRLVDALALVTRRALEVRIGELEASLRSRGASVLALGRERDDLMAARKTIETQSASARMRLEDEVRRLRPGRDKLSKNAQETTADLRKKAQRIIDGMGASSAFSTADLIDLNTELGWSARDLAHGYEADCRAFLGELAIRLPSIVRSSLDSVLADLPKTTDTWVIERLQYVGNIELDPRRKADCVARKRFSSRWAPILLDKATRLRRGVAHVAFPHAVRAQPRAVRRGRGLDAARVPGRGPRARRRGARAADARGR